MDEITNGGGYDYNERATAAGLALAGALAVAWLAGMVYVIASWSAVG